MQILASDNLKINGTKVENHTHKVWLFLCSQAALVLLIYRRIR